MKNSVGGTFRSLGFANYRLWAGGAIVSNIGTWMQRTAQDWLVLTQLTHHNATAVGIVMALQYGPQLAFLPITGLAADHVDRRRLLMITQSVMGVLAAGLGVLTVSGFVRLWHVYVFAFLLGTAAAFDAPARQTFVGDLVGEADLSNAVALNASSFHTARMIGPAIAGLLIARIGTGPVFFVNAVSFAAVLCALGLMRTADLSARPRPAHKRGSLVEGFRYVWRRPDLQSILLMIFLIGTFGLNFPLFISTMAVSVFHAGAQAFGLLTSAMAVGSVTGALLSARRSAPKREFLIGSALVFGVGCATAAVMPSYALFGVALAIVGLAAQTFTTTANGSMQLATEPSMRGRVMAIFLAIALGCTPLGAPVIGWVADSFGARYGLAVAAIAGLAAAAVGLFYQLRPIQGPTSHTG